MKRLWMGMMIFAVALVAGWGTAQAQYRPAPASRGQEVSSEEGFDEAVDLKRFRRGNFEWDTQELIASGFRALHQENLRIQRDLAELKRSVQEIKAKK
ncbi:MAG: hypothetical protein HYZ93_00540 [Candidatus Omnitrophica bacterium]|nr:hypothetical protein [Candidatus Omnitrophota bacterium]